ncbi:MAG: hypothetical protein KDB03_18040 [Planctomycetales bacterium]|nr:hypothetical protein [Planctomycetales bacterium]
MVEKNYCYVFIRADMSCRVFCTPLGGAEGGTLKASRPPLDVYTKADDIMYAVLAEGWAPVRECGLGNGDALLVFEKTA